MSFTRKEIEELKEMIDKQPYSFLLMNPKQKEFEKILRENKINIRIYWDDFCDENKAYFIPYTDATDMKFFFKGGNVVYDNKDKKLVELRDSISDILLDYTNSIDELHDVVDEIMEKVVEILEDKNKED